jgi:hypothetical protein
VGDHIADIFVFSLNDEVMRTLSLSKIVKKLDWVTLLEAMQ